MIRRQEIPADFDLVPINNGIALGRAVAASSTIDGRPPIDTPSFNARRVSLKATQQSLPIQLDADTLMFMQRNIEFRLHLGRNFDQSIVPLLRRLAKHAGPSRWSSKLSRLPY